jgi:hypothetical protein
MRSYKADDVLTEFVERIAAGEATFAVDGPSACARDGFRRGWPGRLRPRRLSKGMARAPAPEAAFEGAKKVVG